MAPPHRGTGKGAHRRGRSPAGQGRSQGKRAPRASPHPAIEGGPTQAAQAWPFRRGQAQRSRGGPIQAARLPGQRRYPARPCKAGTAAGACLDPCPVVSCGPHEGGPDMVPTSNAGRRATAGAACASCVKMYQKVSKNDTASAPLVAEYTFYELSLICCCSPGAVASW